MGDENQIRFSFGQNDAGGLRRPVDEEVDLFYYLKILRRHRKLILGGVLAITIGALVVSFFIPPVYEARTSIIPRAKERNSSMAALLGRMNSIIDLGGMGVAPEGDADRFINVLESRTLAQSVVEKLDLLPVLFKSERTEGGWRNPDRHPAVNDAVNLLKEGVVSIGTNNHGLITITAQWTDPEAAAAIAGEYVTELERYLRENDLTVASKHKSFVKGRLDEAQIELKEAEEALRIFCEKNGVISLPEQTQLLFEQITALYLRVRIKETELDVLKKTVGASNPEISRKQMEIDSMLQQIRDLEKGKNMLYVESNGYIPLYKLPEKSLEFARKTREVTIKQSVFSYLQTEFESAKIAENREAISFVRLDSAVKPDFPVRPNRPLIVGLAGVVSCLAMFMLASFLEYVERRRREESAQSGPPSA